jgi:hypothetical protein
MKMEANDSHPLLELSLNDNSAIRAQPRMNSTNIAATAHHLPQNHNISPSRTPLATQASHQQNQGNVELSTTSGDSDSNINISSRRPSAISGTSGNAPQSTEMKGNHAAKRWNIKLWSSINRLICNTWLVEIASLFLSVGSLVAIITLLVVFDQNVLPEWPYDINLNALVSVFATILTSTLTQATGSAIGESIEALPIERFCMY